MYIYSLCPYIYLLILCITSYLTKMGDDDVDDENKKCVYIYLLYNVVFFFTIIITANNLKM